MTTALGGPDQEGSLPGLPESEAAELAARFGMSKVGVRPSVPDYLRELWRSRHLTWSLSEGEFLARHQNNYLGLLWSVINPLLLATVYYLIFGLLISGVRGGIDNFISFLTMGLFTYMFIAHCLTTGSKAVVGRIGMVRALKFPRVMLPITVVLSEFLNSVPAFLILMVIAVMTGETPNIEWLLFPVALAVVAMLGLSLALIGSRIMYAVRDASNLLPLMTRMLRYVSGVFFSIEHSTAKVHAAGHHWLAYVLEYQPVAVAMTMVRETLSDQYPVRWQTWTAAGGWAVALLVLGFWLFWRAEGTYGRD